MSTRSESKNKKQGAKTTRASTFTSKKQQAPKSNLQQRRVKPSDAQTKERPDLRGSHLDGSFSVKDPRAMLREHLTETQKTIETIAEGRTVERSALANALFQKLAFRLALIG